jgi:hypothetical protein
MLVSDGRSSRLRPRELPEWPILHETDWEPLDSLGESVLCVRNLAVQVDDQSELTLVVSTDPDAGHARHTQELTCVSLLDVSELFLGGHVKPSGDRFIFQCAPAYSGIAARPERRRSVEGGIVGS